MPSLDSSINTESPYTSDSHGSGAGPSRSPLTTSSRRNVRYVNDRREFDPQYDPRNPDSFVLYHQPQRRDEEGERDCESPTNHHDHYQSQLHKYAKEKGNAASSRLVWKSRQASNPSTTSSPASTRIVRNTFFKAEDAQLDRPFDEVSNRDSTASFGVDSLEEVLDHDSNTTGTSDGEISDGILSPIQEHPSLEAGSLSYSFTHYNPSITSHGNRSNPVLDKATYDSEYSSEENNPFRSSSSSHSTSQSSASPRPESSSKGKKAIVSKEEAIEYSFGQLLNAPSSVSPRAETDTSFEQKNIPARSAKSFTYNPFSTAPSESDQSFTYNPFSKVPSQSVESFRYNPFSMSSLRSGESNKHKLFSKTPPQSAESLQRKKHGSISDANSVKSFQYNPFSKAPTKNVKSLQGSHSSASAFASKSVESFEYNPFSKIPSESVASFQGKHVSVTAPKSAGSFQYNPFSKAPASTSSILSQLTPVSALNPPSTANNSLASETARLEAEKLVKGFSSIRRITIESANIEGQEQQPATSASPSEDSSKSTADPTEDTNTLHTEEKDFMLHDLCGESSSTNDVAWRNALHVLSLRPKLASVRDSAGWTPLHVACFSSTPAPVFMIRSLLYVYRGAAHQVDGGGRLPLHLVADSSGDVATMKLLVQENPQALYQKDCFGWNPLHLMLKNLSLNITLDHCRLLLGLMNPENIELNEKRVLQRRGNHLNLRLEELEQWSTKKTPISQLAQDEFDEETFRSFPTDVQTSLRRLYKWKRKLRRSDNQSTGGETIELDMAPSHVETETNPAAQITPSKHQLPIHMIVHRGLSGSSAEPELMAGFDGNEEEQPTSMAKSDVMPFNTLELVRLFVAAYPESLVVCDAQGHTPLMAALLMDKVQPSQRLVELLLGKNTPGYDSLPTWIHNIPIGSVNLERYLNPAMVPYAETQQLPLHVVAEEMADNYNLLATVHDSYPGAMQVQDSRGRTPLHHLLRNFRRAPFDPAAVTLLLSDRVAQTFDDDGKLPFDLLAENANQISVGEPTTDKDTSLDVDSFKNFFQKTIIASSKPQAGTRMKKDSFLWRLRALPPWLRRQALSASFVQTMIIAELASPLRCAFVMLHAALLCLLTISFRSQLHQYAERSGDMVPMATLLLVGLSAFSLLLFQVVFWTLCIYMSDFLRLCVFNIWRWVDLLAIVMVVSTTVMVNYGSASVDATVTAGTIATCLLWLSTISFLSTWWYGAAVFTALVRKVIHWTLWPMTVMAISAVMFAEMFFTFSQTDCVNDTGDTGICDTRESYRIIYYLLAGEPIIDLGSESQTPKGITVLMLLFIFAFLTFGLTLLSTIMLMRTKWDYEHVALSSFWEPVLTFILFSSGSAFSEGKLQQKLEDRWDEAINILVCRHSIKGKYWYTSISRSNSLVRVLCWVLTTLFILVWVIFGALTFGVLWPPQVRKLLFQSAYMNDAINSKGKELSPTELHAMELSSLRKELSQAKEMTFENSNDIQKEVRQIKEILRLATAESEG